MTLYYAGIGSRETPAPVLKRMEELARLLSHRFILRSGHAPGADQAFGRGAGAKAELFLPWARFERAVPTWGATIHLGGPDLSKYVRKFHPAPDKLSSGAWELMSRNVNQILGPAPGVSGRSSLVVCWTKNGSDAGGTGFAIRMAWEYSIPVVNLQWADAEERLREELGRILGRE